MRRLWSDSEEWISSRKAAKTPRKGGSIQYSVFSGRWTIDDRRYRPPSIVYRPIMKSKHFLPLTLFIITATLMVAIALHRALMPARPVIAQMTRHLGDDRTRGHERAVERDRDHQRRGDDEKGEG